MNGTRYTIERGELEGNKVQFIVGRTLDGQTTRMLFYGRVKGNSIEGSIKTDTESATRTNRWIAKRDPSTVTPIEGSEILH